MGLCKHPPLSDHPPLTPILTEQDTAQAFAENGARVYITGRRLPILQKSASIHGDPARLDNGGEMIPLAMDITDKESIKGVVEIIREKENM